MYLFGNARLRSRGRMTRLHLALIAFLAATLVLTGATDFAAVPTAYAVSDYTLRVDQPRQTLWGLGVEIQSDSIGSGNNGLPAATTSVPHDLVANERTRFYKDMLKGFRYVRLAMGLYFRGLDAEQKQIVERFPGQAALLRDMIEQSGMEGAAVEYWSPAPYWKSSNSYINGSLKQFDAAFLDQFGDALVQDVNYLKSKNIPVVQWGLQNEPAIGDAPYSSCYYTGNQYYTTFKAVAAKIRTNFPDVFIHANSWNGQSGFGGPEIRADATALSYVDGWTWHRIGTHSNEQITTNFTTNSVGKYVFNNEFEYLSGGATNDRFINTTQSIMNWMTFQNSPTWFWLHALKPTYNSEASGYALGFWRPEDDTDFTKYGNIQPGHWDYNKQNWHSIAGFLEYMPWNSVRYGVDEATVRNDNRIMAWKTPQGKFVIALTNRSSTNSFTFNIDVGGNRSFAGYRYTPSQANIALGARNGTAIAPTLPPQSVEFWVEQTSPPNDAAEVVLDNGQTGYSETGTWVASSLTGYNNSSTRYSTTDGSSAKWTPSLPASGNYQVYAWYPYYATNTTAATYTITHNGGTTSLLKNQTQQAGGWTLLGTYNFVAGTSGSVELTVGGGITHRADAIRFVRTSSTLFTDSFESGSGNWQAVAGSWTTAADSGSQVYRQTATTATSNRAVANGGSWMNSAVQAKVKFEATAADTSSSAAGLIARYTDDNNFYLWRLNKIRNKAELYKRSGGTFTLLEEVGLPAVSNGTWYTLKLEVSGSNLIGYINGEQRVSVVDTSVTGAGKAGLQTYSAQASFDDVVVTNLQ
jgi:O-glycosyl hydrolase